MVSDYIYIVYIIHYIDIWTFDVWTFRAVLFTLRETHSTDKHSSTATAKMVLRTG